MTDPGLFPEPVRVELPTMDGHWAIARHGWRYMLLGEDGQYLIIQGHAPDSAIAELLPELPAHYGILAPSEVTPVDTWARELTACPTHSPKDASDDCSWCHATPDEPLWDWTTPKDQPDANRGAEGYFPATVIDLEV